MAQAPYLASFAAQMHHHTFDAMGDSLTRNLTTGQFDTDFYTKALEAKLQAGGCLIQGRNFGISGDTTAPAGGNPGMTSRIWEFTNFEVPDMVILHGGTNDPANGINAAGTTANLQSIVAQLQALGVSRFLVCTVHYLNYSAGGDTGVAQGQQVAAYYAIRQAQRAAVAAGQGQVLLCDLFSYFAGLIGQTITWNGAQYTFAQGDHQWHVVDSNIHLNALGHELCSRSMLSVIQGAGWDVGWKS